MKIYIETEMTEIPKDCSECSICGSIFYEERQEQHIDCFKEFKRCPLVTIPDRGEAENKLEPYIENPANVKYMLDDLGFKEKVKQP